MTIRCKNCGQVGTERNAQFEISKALGLPHLVCTKCGSSQLEKAEVRKPQPELWEILVPTTRNDGRAFHLRYHRVWDQKVRDITGGLTILPVAKGQWVHEQKLYAERMIPVRILATREQMERIIEMTIQYYEQIAVLAYRISTVVILKHRPEGKRCK